MPILPLTHLTAFGASLTLYTVLLIAGTKPSFSDLLSDSELTTVRSALSDAVDLLSRFGENSLVISRCHDCLVNFLRAYDLVVVEQQKQQQESHTTTAAIAATVQTSRNSVHTSSSQSLPLQEQGQGQGQGHVSVIGDGNGVSSSLSSGGYVGVLGNTLPPNNDVDVDYYTGAPLTSIAALGDFTGVPLDFGHWGDPLPYM